jgi:hypothetical protein
MVDLVENALILIFEGLAVFFQPLFSLFINFHLIHIFAVSLQFFNLIQDRSLIKPLRHYVSKAFDLFGHEIDVYLVSMRLVEVNLEG